VVHFVALIIVIVIIVVLLFIVIISSYSSHFLKNDANLRSRSAEAHATLAMTGCVSELAGKSYLEDARIDMIVDCLDDAIKPFFNPGHIMNPDADAKVG